MRDDPLRAEALITFLPTADLAATHAFYADALGLALVRDQGVCRIYRAMPDAYLGFCDRGAPVSAEHRVVLTLVVADVDAAHAAVLERGLVPEGPPAHHARYAVTSFFVRDPNGYLVEYQRFDEPLPPAVARPAGAR